MQLALAAGPISAPAPLWSTTKVNRLLAAGVAVAGAGLLAVAPVVPQGVQHRAVQLTSTWDTASDNLDSLMALISANPDPVGTALGDLFGSYSDVAETSLEGSMAGIEGIWSGLGPAQGLETLLPQISDLIADGNITEAYSQLNTEMLFDMLNVFQPLFNYIPYQETEEVAGLAGLGATMMRDFANVQDVFADFATWKAMSEALMSPVISATFALTDNFTDTGDHVPQDVLDAFLNGYIPWGPAEGSDETHHALVGFLTEGGPIDYFYRELPEEIAAALTQNLSDDAPETAALSATDALADASWMDLFDGSGVADLLG